MCRSFVFKSFFFCSPFVRLVRFVQGSPISPARHCAAPSEDYFHAGGLGLACFMNEATDGRGASRARKKKTMKTTSQKNPNSLPQESEQSQLPARKHDAQLAAARLNPAWVEFEAGIFANDFLRARITRCLDRYGLGSSSVMVDGALDFLIHKDLGDCARYFTQTGKCSITRRQVSNAVITFMSRKEQERHMTDLAINEDDADHSEDLPGSVRASHLADFSVMAPDEVAARSEARRAFYTISAAIPAQDRELYTLLLGLGETGTRTNIEAYASRMKISASTVYDRLKKLGKAIQLHPLFTQIATTYRTDFQPA